MPRDKNIIQFLINEYLLRHGSIDITLPDRIELEIGITQETKHGLAKQEDYCWVITKRNDKTTLLDRYSMSLSFDDANCSMIDKGRGVVTVL